MNLAFQVLLKEITDDGIALRTGTGESTVELLGSHSTGSCCLREMVKSLVLEVQIEFQLIVYFERRCMYRNSKRFIS